MRPIYKIMGIAALLALILSAPVFADTASDLKQQINDRNKEIQQLEEEIKQYQGSIDEAESTAQTLKGEIKRLDQEVKKLNAQISLTQKKIAAKELEIKGLGEDIVDTEDSIKNRQAALAKILESLNNTEKENYLERFFKYNSVSDFLAELEKIRALDESVHKNYEELKALKADLEDRKKKAEQARRDLKNLKSDLLAQREIQKDAKAEKTNLLSATKNQEALYQKLLRDRERRRAEVYSEIQLIENDLKKQIDFGTLPTFGHGILENPIDGGVITQEFGKTSFSRYTDVYGASGHNGIDLRAAVGTPVRAADGGFVKATGNSDYICPRGSYGKWILLTHPNNLATLYAHLSLIKVAPGTTIKRGDLIAYSGDTGYTTGPHLHFTVYDARTVELRPQRTCGITPFGGYLDPMLYMG